MQENSWTDFSYVLSWLIHVFTGTLDKYNVNFKVSGTCFTADTKPWGKAGALQS